MEFSTKASTLLFLKPLLKNAQIPEIFAFTVEQWHAEKKSILKSLESSSLIKNWIVRSSTASEDQKKYSNAGKYSTILNVETDNLLAAVEDVIASYDEKSALNEVLLQPMLNNIIRSGVAFTHDPSTNSPYRVINFSEGSDSTVVTSGAGGLVWQHAAGTRFPIDSRVELIVPLMEELLAIFEHNPLDIEFAITMQNNVEELWLLQVRPLVLSPTIETTKDQTDRLSAIEKTLSENMGPHPFLFGKRTVYGIMPDWNPAEIIGIRPKPLSLSLYKEMITDSIWAYQRNNYGYMNLRSFPLLTHFFGTPYIDVRVSFNSFIPSTLNEGIADKLVNFYIEKLVSLPELHDKIEFDIVYSCYTLDFPLKVSELKAHGFSKFEIQELAQALRLLTNNVINPKSGLWQEDAKKLDTLVERRNKILNSSSDAINKIYWLLEDGKRYGTLPFAGLARAGFIAVQILKSLVSLDIFTKDDYSEFMRSFTTVTGQLNKDKRELDKFTFLKKYGHLRPGTYEITSPRYDENPNLYFNWEESNVFFSEPLQFHVSSEKLKLISKLLVENQLDSDPDSLLDFIKSAITLRELAKFEFTKNLSEILVLIEKVGEDIGFKKDRLSYSEISAFKSLYMGTQNTKELISESIASGSKRYKQTLLTSLPPLILSPQDIWGFQWPESVPNFIGQKSVTGDVAKSVNIKDLNNKIVCIEQADPGFDWIFSHKISGLITAWGGANSHMAIRAGELNLPAVIGTGAALFEKYSNATKLRLDCANKRIEILKQ